MVAFDNNIFALALHPNAKGTEPGAREKVEYLLLTLKEEEERIVLPTPVLAEFLVFAGDEAPLYLEKLRDNSIFRVEPFDERAAIELAHVEITSRKRGNKKGKTDDSPWQKVKFDRQILAVAKVNGAICIYSTDADLVKHAEDFGITAKTVADLPRPPAVQENLFPKTEDEEARGAGDTEPKVAPVPIDVRSGGDGHPEDQAGAEGTEENSKDKEAGT